MATYVEHMNRIRIKQAVRVATQYASARSKLTISSHLFARWRCCSGITIYSYLFSRWHLFRHVGYLRHQQQVDL